MCGHVTPLGQVSWVRGSSAPRALGAGLGFGSVLGGGRLPLARRGFPRRLARLLWPFVWRCSPLGLARGVRVGRLAVFASSRPRRFGPRFLAVSLWAVAPSRRVLALSLWAVALSLWAAAPSPLRAAGPRLVALGCRPLAAPGRGSSPCRSGPSPPRRSGPRVLALSLWAVALSPLRAEGPRLVALGRRPLAAPGRRSSPCRSGPSPPRRFGPRFLALSLWAVALSPLRAAGPRLVALGRRPLAALGRGSSPCRSGPPPPRRFGPRVLALSLWAVAPSPLRAAGPCLVALGRRPLAASGRGCSPCRSGPSPPGAAPGRGSSPCRSGPSPPRGGRSLAALVGAVRSPRRSGPSGRRVDLAGSPRG